MGSRYEVEVTICSARELKNVNWRHGDLKPYAVVWIDPSAKCSTKSDIDGDTSPVWEDKLTIPLGGDLNDAILHIDIVHALDDHSSDFKVKPLIGSARLPLSQVLDEAGIGGKSTRSLKLKRPSGRPQGKLEVKVRVAELPLPPPPRHHDHYAPPPYTHQPAAPYGRSRDYPPAPYGQPYAAAPAAGYPYSGPPQQGGYGYGYGAAPPAASYGGYGAAPPASSYGQSQGSSYAAQPVAAEKKKSKYGMGTGLAVGAVAGVLGGLAIAEGVDFVEDKIADRAAEKVEDDEIGYDYGDF